MHKKVGTITLEYDLSDGLGPRSAAFQGEFNDVIIRGDVSGLEGIFEGDFTADSIDIVGNLNIAGKATAITTLSILADKQGGMDDDNVWRTVHQIAFLVPAEDLEGGYYSCSMQYELVDDRGDNAYFPCDSRILVDGADIWYSSVTEFRHYYQGVRWFSHELAGQAVGPGTHTITLQYRFGPYDTNVYPHWRNLIFRVDYVRR